MATSKGATYAVSQRADHIWEGVSSATTRSRPIINTRDEPHADAEHYRRLHVIVGDSNMSESTTMLKVGSCDLVLRMIEAGVVMRDLTLENPIRAIREISHDTTGRRTVRLANGRQLSALDLQREYHAKAVEFVAREGASDPLHERVLDLWDRTLTAVETGDLGLVGTEIDWVIKYRLIEDYATKHGLDLDHPRLAQIDLAYHDIDRSRGLFYLLQRRGLVARVVTDPEIFAAKVRPPETTRAKLRGDFIRAAQEHRRDFTVDWVHLKLNDQAQRTVLCKDPFLAAGPPGRAADRGHVGLIAAPRSRAVTWATRAGFSQPAMREFTRGAVIVGCCCPLHDSPPTEGSSPVSRRLTTALSAAVLASALVLSACGEEAATKPSAAISAVTVDGSRPRQGPDRHGQGPAHRHQDRVRRRHGRHGGRGRQGRPGRHPGGHRQRPRRQGRQLHLGDRCRGPRPRRGGAVRLVEEPAARQEDRLAGGHHLDPRRRVR